MTPQNTCATCDFYRTGSTPGHGSCHLNPPGNAVSHGFPLVAAIEWCAKGATGRVAWSPELPPIVIEFRSPLVDSCEVSFPGPSIQLKEDESRQAYKDTLQHIASEQLADSNARIVTLLARNLWQRICNTVPWEGK